MVRSHALLAVLCAVVVALAGCARGSEVREVAGSPEGPAVDDLRVGEVFEANRVRLGEPAALAADHDGALHVLLASGRLLRIEGAQGTVVADLEPVNTDAQPDVHPARRADVSVHDGEVLAVVGTSSLYRVASDGDVTVVDPAAWAGTALVGVAAAEDGTVILVDAVVDDPADRQMLVLESDTPAIRQDWCGPEALLDFGHRPLPFREGVRVPRAVEATPDGVWTYDGVCMGIGYVSGDAAGKAVAAHCLSHVGEGRYVRDSARIPNTALAAWDGHGIVTAGCGMLELITQDDRRPLETPAGRPAGQVVREEAGPWPVTIYDLAVVENSLYVLLDGRILAVELAAPDDLPVVPVPAR